MSGYTRYPTRREDDGASPFRVIIGIVIVFLVTIVAAFMFTRDVEGNHHSATPYPSHDSLGPTYLHDGQDVIRWYVFTDPDTGVQYLVNDRGGCTPRLEEKVEKAD